MHYIETITSKVAAGDLHTEPIPTDILGAALDMRTSPLVQDTLEWHAANLHLDELTPEDKYLFQTRIIGGMTTRLALASFQTVDTPAFIDLSETQQADHIDTLITSYDTKTDGQNALQINTATDPLNAITHAKTKEWVYESRAAALTKRQHRALLTSYVNVLPGTFPKQPHTIAPIAKNDATYTQAFGRDTIDDKELPIIKDAKARYTDSEMIAYLASISFLPGPSNESLAEVVNNILTSDTPNEQMIQWEVAYALYEKYPDTFTRFSEYLHILWPQRDFYPTFEVKDDSKNAALLVGAFNPAELAHGDMMIRALGILYKQGEIADPVAADIPFDPNSTQPHVRNARAWTGREALARVEHVLRRRVGF